MILNQIWIINSLSFYLFIFLPWSGSAVERCGADRGVATHLRCERHRLIRSVTVNIVMAKISKFNFS